MLQNLYAIRTYFLTYVCKKKKTNKCMIKLREVNSAKCYLKLFIKKVKTVIGLC